MSAEAGWGSLDSMWTLELTAGFFERRCVSVCGASTTTIYSYLSTSTTSIVTVVKIVLALRCAHARAAYCNSSAPRRAGAAPQAPPRRGRAALARPVLQGSNHACLNLGILDLRGEINRLDATLILNVCVGTVLEQELDGVGVTTDDREVE